MKHRTALLAVAAVAAVPMIAAAARPPLPDLVVAHVSGTARTVTIRVRNQGTAPSPAGLVNISLGQPIGEAKNFPMPALGAGQVNSVIAQIGKPVAGVHYTIRLDPNKAIAESNENNNAASGNFAAP